jgi:hypothetical protein
MPIHHQLVFKQRDNPAFGCAFPCDETGKVDAAVLDRKPAMKANHAAIVADGAVHWHPPIIESRELPQHAIDALTK